MSSELTEQEDIDFAKAFEESIKEVHSGETIKGIVARITGNSIIIDLGFKSDGIMPFEQYSDEPTADPVKELSVGQEIEAYVVRVNDGEGNVLLSRKKIESIKMWDEIDRFVTEKIPVTVKVVKEVGVGLLANKNGIRVFIPASQLTQKDAVLKDYVGNNLTIRILEVNKDRRKVIGSERIIAKEARQEQEAKVWEEISEGQELTGTVKKIEKFGAFVDIGGVDGLVHISELSWGKIKSPEDVVRVGDIVHVYVLGVDKEKHKISLGYKRAEDNPWNNIEEKYKVSDIVEVLVKKIMPFGVFVQIEPGLEGLIHISNISHKRIGTPLEVVKVGDYVKAKIMQINMEKKEIELSMKELEEEQIEA